MSQLRCLSVLVLLLALAACGDNLVIPDARPIDMREDVIPPAPRLGMQIERMGRPAINTALVGLRDANPTMKKDAYNAASDPAMWGAAQVGGGRSIVAEFAESLALLDVLDQGNQSIPGTPGCGNQVLYNGQPTGGGTPGATSYNTLATILADDMLYVDTTKTTCAAYLSLEVDVATGGAVPHSQCGGRTPTHDVIDVSFSALISGINGFTLPPALVPRISDGVPAHTDLSDTVFPYFGPPR
jgi:hypothetical protein